MHIGAHTERNDTEWYVSWWPEGDSVFNESRGCNTLSGDWSGEGGLPHVVYKVYGGDIDVMKTVWDASRNKPAAHYDIFKKNCSTLVARILNAGGAQEGHEQMGALYAGPPDNLDPSRRCPVLQRTA